MISHDYAISRDDDDDDDAISHDDMISPEDDNDDDDNYDDCSAICLTFQILLH